MAVTAPNSSNFRILSSFIERCNGKLPLVPCGQTEYSLQFINSSHLYYYDVYNLLTYFIDFNHFSEINISSGIIG